MKQDNIKYQRIDKGWGRMEMLLDEKMPKKKRRYPIWIFFLFGISACVVAVVQFGSFGSGSATQDPLNTINSESSSIVLNETEDQTAVIDKKENVTDQKEEAVAPLQ